MRQYACVELSRCLAADRIAPWPSTHTKATVEQAPIRTTAFPWRSRGLERRPAIAVARPIRRSRYPWRAAEGILATRRFVLHRRASYVGDAAYSGRRA